MKLTEKLIEEIADNLDSGMRCFYHLKTGELTTQLNLDSWIYGDNELWEEAYEEMEKNQVDYFEFVGLETHEVFQIMADFAESVDDPGLQYRLINALKRRHPFRNFKWQIDNSGPYRQQWFDFKNMRYVEWVKTQIELNKEYFNE